MVTIRPQVLGDTRAAFDISEHDTLIFGEHGLLIAGPNSRHHEPLLCSYLEVGPLGAVVITASPMVIILRICLRDVSACSLSPWIYFAEIFSSVCLLYWTI